MTKKSLIIGALAVAGAAYLVKRYRNGGDEQLKEMAAKAKHHLTNVFSRAKEHATQA